jgi:hypothetical protein
MLILLTQSWPWIVIGALLIAWGQSAIKLTMREWMAFLLSLPFMFFTEPTSREKRDYERQQTQGMIEENPGCGLLLAGMLSLCYGIVKVFF